MIPDNLKSHLVRKDAAVAENYVANQVRRARLKAIDECIVLMQELHGRTLGRHNYYANAAQELKRLKKK